ncbi:MAG: TonB family protein [Pseudomonadota bacterium]
MTRLTWSGVIVALVLSLAVHVALAAGIWTERKAQIQGGAPTTEARLGNSFADMVQGIMVPEIPASLQEPNETPIERAETLEPERSDAVAPADTSQAADLPVDTAVAVTEPTRPGQDLGVAEENIPTETSAEPEGQMRETAPPPELPDASQPIELNRALEQAILPNAANPEAPRETVRAAPPEPRPEETDPEPTQPEEAVQPDVADRVALAPAEPPPELSETLSPNSAENREAERTLPEILESVPIEVRRPVASTQRPRPRPEPRSDPPALSPSVGGAENTRRGISDGSENADSSQRSNNPSNRAQPGNSASVSNYEGQVRARLDRVRKPNGLQRGQTVIGFRIAPNGSVASARIIRPSGSARLDQAAVRHVYRAAPFPPPPRGLPELSYEFVSLGQGN